MRSPLGTLARTLSNRSPVPLSLPFRAGGSGGFGLLARTRVDDERLMETYATSGTIYGIVSRLASATSAPEWQLWRKATSGLKEDRVQVTSHPALDLINNPNPFMTRQEFMEASQQFLDLTGEADVLLTKFGKIPVEMWSVRPDRVKPIPHPFNFIEKYVYTSPGGAETDLKINDVIQVRLPNPLDPYSGLGPVQSILTDIDSSRYSAEWNKNFFLNSAQPGGIIEVPNRLDDDAFTEMRTRWNEQHKGITNAHRVALIEAGAKWVDRTVSQKEMQFAELRGISRDTILEAFGFPRFALGIVEDVNRASADASEYFFQKWLIITRLERWKGAFNHDLLPQFAGGDQLEFDYVSPLSEDTEAANARLSAQWQAVGVAVPLGFDPAEVLESVGLPALKFEKPEPKIVQLPPAPGSGQEGEPPANVKAMLHELSAWARAQEIEAAQKWEAVEEEDDSTCEPCKANRGKTYKNREEAYKDYPNGKGFKDCVGAEFGNDCRGHVRKRKADQ